MSEQLKACPFCGGADIRIHKHPGEGTGLHHQGDDVYSMGCYGCGAMFPSCYRPALFAEKWNTRAQDFDTLAQRLQEAERLLREAAAELEDWRLSFPDANSRRTDVLTEQIDAFLTGSGGKA